MPHRDTIGVVTMKKRMTGQTSAFCRKAAIDLNNGGKVGILDINAHRDDSYLQIVVKILADSHNIKVDITPTFRLDPPDNKKIIYDKWGEPAGIEILPQEKIKTGWILKKSTI